MYFARVFEHIGKTKFNNLGPHKLNGTDLFHGHLIKGWDNDMYVVFHAKEFPDDIPMEQQGGYETTDAAYAYRNVLWKGATRQVWALNAAGSLDGDRIYVYDRDSSEIFKNLIFPFSHADASPANDSGVLLNKWTSVKTVYETYLGVPRAILCYRWMRRVRASARRLQRAARAGPKVTWDASKVDRLLSGPADVIPVEDVTGLAMKQDAR
jgi:hypothetical protein